MKSARPAMQNNPTCDTYRKRLLTLIIVMVILGLVVIYSSTIVHSQAVYKVPYRFVMLQLGWIITGGLISFILYKLGIHRYKGTGYLLLVLSFIFLSVLAVSGLLPCGLSLPFTPCVNDANRWFIINPSPLPPFPILGELGFQPSELAKLGLILYLSVKLPTLVKKRYEAFWVYFITTSVVSGLVLLQPNMSTSVMIFVLGTIIYVTSGASVKPLFIVLPLLIFLSLLFAISSPYRRDRIMTFLSSDRSESDLSSGYHVKQVSIALGSGGLLGVGFGQSKQKYYLPEVSSDSIFAIIGEEFGLLGSLSVVILFFLFVYYGLSLAGNLSEQSDRLLVTGITSWIGLQFFVHVAANILIIPYTGVPIPLMSYGGSSMVFTLMGLGMMLSTGRRL